MCVTRDKIIFLLETLSLSRYDNHNSLHNATIRVQYTLARKTPCSSKFLWLKFSENPKNETFCDQKFCDCYIFCDCSGAAAHVWTNHIVAPPTIVCGVTSNLQLYVARLSFVLAC